MSGESSEPRRLLRTANDKKIAGICGGFGSYFKVDPTLVRVLWILAVFLSAGVALLLYLILWIVMPLDIDPDTLSSRST
ncbi:MAG: PspC domain-containing protein [bacterium]|nr:PspC domain-containing protein [bacterium]MBK8130518.1 PspC domain-containing protein [bacterium]